MRRNDKRRRRLKYRAASKEESRMRNSQTKFETLLVDTLFRTVSGVLVNGVTFEVTR